MIATATKTAAPASMWGLRVDLDGETRAASWNELCEFTERSRKRDIFVLPPEDREGFSLVRHWFPMSDDGEWWHIDFSACLPAFRALLECGFPAPVAREIETGFTHRGLPIATYTEGRNAWRWILRHSQRRTLTQWASEAETVPSYALPPWHITQAFIDLHFRYANYGQ